MFSAYRKLVVALVLVAINLINIWRPDFILDETQAAQIADLVLTVANVAGAYLVYRVPNSEKGAANAPA